MSAFLEPDPSILENNLLVRTSNSDGTYLENPVFFGNGSPADSTIWKLATPVPGFCIKTSDLAKNKVFINICQLDEIPEPRDITETQLMEIWNSEEVSDYRIPLSLQEPHDEFDKSGKPTVVYDVAINPNFFTKIQKSLIFHSFLMQVVFEGLESKYSIELEKERYITLKNRKCLGNLRPHRIKVQTVSTLGPKKPNKPLIEELPATARCYTANRNSTQERTPPLDFRLFENIQKRMLIGEFYMPGITSLGDVYLNVSQDRITMECRRKNYSMDLFIPLRVNPDGAQAFYFRAKNILSIHMPII